MGLSGVAQQEYEVRIRLHNGLFIKLLETTTCEISISYVFDVFETEPGVTRFQFRVKSLANESG